MQVLSADQIRKAAGEAAAPRALLVVPELGGAIYVRGMGGTERDAFEEGLRIKKGRRTGQSDLTNFRARLAVRCIVNEQGDRILANAAADVLGRLPAGVLDRILAKITELSGKAADEV